MSRGDIKFLVGVLVMLTGICVIWYITGVLPKNLW